MSHTSSAPSGSATICSNCTPRTAICCISSCRRCRTSAATNMAARCEKRMRYPLEVFAAIRAVWPKDKPLGIRVSAVDWVDGGTTIEDTVKFAHELKALGCDYMDVSSRASWTRGRRFPSRRISTCRSRRRCKKATGLPTMSVGLITSAREAEDAIASGKADMVALAAAPCRTRAGRSTRRWNWAPSRRSCRA